MAKHLSPQDFVQNEIRNAVVQNLAAAPATPKVGQVYYDTTKLAQLLWNGTAWITSDATQAIGIPNTALSTNPLLRSNHTGTQLSGTISDFSTAVKATTLDQFAQPVANVAFNSKNITNLADPVNPQDAATKNYTDIMVSSAALGIASKTPVAVVSVAAVATLSGLPTVDGVALTAGQRVLLVAQTTASQNGPYIVAAGAWVRPSGDADPNGDLSLGATWFVEQGTLYSASSWRIATPTAGTITPGTTSITIVQIAAPINYSASNGITLSGNNFSAQAVTSGGILVSASGLSIDTTVVARKYSQAIGDGSTTSIVVTHSLSTTDIVAAVRDTSGNWVDVDWQATTASTATFSFSVAPGASAYRVTIIG